MTERAYVRDGAEIYRRSFAIIHAESDLARFNAAEEPVAVRIIHASACPRSPATWSCPKASPNGRARR